MQRLLNAALTSTQSSNRNTKQLTTAADNDYQQQYNVYDNNVPASVGVYLDIDDRISENEGSRSGGGDCIFSCGHSKKPSFSITTSDFSRVYNNPSCNADFKQSIISKNTYNAHEISSVLFNKKQPKEIEEFFESTRKYYQKSRGGMITGLQERNTISGGFMKHQQQQQQHFSLNTLQWKQEKTKKHVYLIRIDKKQCQDDEAIAYNSLTSYKKDRSSSNSIGSDSLVSSSSAKSISKPLHISNPQVNLQQDYQTSSIPSTTQSQQRTNQVRTAMSLSSCGNSRQPFSNTTNQIVQNLKQQHQLLQQQKQRYQQHIAEAPLTADIKHMRSQSNRKSMINQENEAPSLRISLSPLQATPYLKKTEFIGRKLFSAHAIPKIQDQSKMPQAKKLSDSSDNDDIINSRDMSRSFTKPNAVGGSGPAQSSKKAERICTLEQDNQSPSTIKQLTFTQSKSSFVAAAAAQQQPQIPQLEDVTKIFSFNGNGTLESQRSMQSNNTQAQLSQKVNCLSNILGEVRNSVSQQQQNGRYNSSAQKRAKWDFSGGKSSVHNSMINNGSSKDQSQPVEAENLSQLNQIQLLQKQYLAIKKQLQDLQNQSVKQESSKHNHHQKSQCIKAVQDPCSGRTQNVQPSNGPISARVDVLTPSIMSNNEESSPDNNRSCLSNSLADLNAANRKKKSNALNGCMPQQQPQHKQMKRNRKSTNHFKSVDVYCAPHNQEQQDEELQRTPSQISHNQEKRLKRKEPQQVSVMDKCKSRESLKKISNIMKSQLQIGLRKLSLTKQQYEKELINHKQMRKSSKHSQQQHKYSKVHKKSAFAKAQSQNSCSHSSSCSSSAKSSSDGGTRYKDCFSGGKCRGLSRKSSSSSRYYLANDGESLCSCCRQELKQSIVKHCQPHRKGPKVMSNENVAGKKQKSRQDARKTMANTISAIASSSNKSMLSQAMQTKKRKSEQHVHLQQQKQQQKVERMSRHSKMIVEEDENTDYDKKKLQKNAKVSKKNNKSRSNHRSRESRHSEVPLQQQQQFYQQQQQYYQGGHTNNSQIYANPWGLSQMQAAITQQSMDYGRLMHQINPQPSMTYVQNLTQPQVLQTSGIQYLVPAQVLNTSAVVYPPLQQAVPQHAHSLPVTIQNTLPMSRQSPSNALSRKTFGGAGLGNSAQQLSSCQEIQILENHREQIETIEELIKQAKYKLDVNLATNSNNQCRRSTHLDSICSRVVKTDLNTHKASRNDYLKNACSSTYNSNPDNQQNMLFNTHFTQISEFSAGGNNNNREDDRPNLQDQLEMFHRHLEDNKRLSSEQQQQRFDQGSNEKVRFSGIRSACSNITNKHYINDSAKMKAKKENIQMQQLTVGQNKRFSKNEQCSSTFNQSISSIGNPLATITQGGISSDAGLNLGGGDKGVPNEKSKNKAKNPHLHYKQNENDYQAWILNSKRESQQQQEQDAIDERQEFNEELFKEQQEQVKEGILWIDFNEGRNAKRQSKRKPMLTSSAKQQQQENNGPSNERKQEGKPSGKRNQAIPEEHEEDFISPNKGDLPIKGITGQESSAVAADSLSQYPQKESWAMDFSNNEDFASISELQKQKRQTLEQRLKQRKDQSSTKQSIKKEYTKEELLERKKELLKNARLSIQQQQQLPGSSQQPEQADQSTTDKAFSAHQEKTVSAKVIKIDIIPNAKAAKIPKTNSEQASLRNSSNNNNLSIPLQLVSRLSSGHKTEISKKDMIKLTSKNYEQLPEIKKRKQDEIKKEDMMKRIATVKELEKKRRQSVVSKRQSKITKDKSQMATTLPSSSSVGAGSGMLSNTMKCETLTKV